MIGLGLIIVVVIAFVGAGILSIMWSLIALVGFLIVIVGLYLMIFEKQYENKMVQLMVLGGLIAVVIGWASQTLMIELPVQSGIDAVRSVIGL